MKWTDVQSIQDTLNAGREVRWERSENRVRVNNAANGLPPLNKEQAKKNNVKVNFNSLELAELLAQARRQYLTGFYHSQRFFSIQCDTMPQAEKAMWEAFITRKLNRIMRKSRKYYALHKSRFMSVVSHGIGACAWFDKDRWLPKYVPLEDLFMPTDTECSFENLMWFGVRVPFTEFELAKRAFGPNALPAWKKKPVASILKEYHDTNYDPPDGGDWINNPEKMWEQVKQNSGYYCSDAVPTIPLIFFFFKDTTEDGEDCWKLRVVPDQGIKGDFEHDDFLYNASTNADGRKIKEKPYAKCLDHILHVQFGDLSAKAPPLLWSVRGLGFMLMEPSYWSNLMLCRLVQHTFEQFNVWLRADDPAGKARAQMINLFDKAVIPPGVSIVPHEQRHQIDAQLVEMVMARMKQLQAEKAAQYTQQVDTGTHKEQTAFETMTKMQQVNAMMAALLTDAFVYEGFLYEEVCRRFCLADSNDKEANRFQKECRDFGIPQQFLNHELWDISVEMPIGQGNPTMGLARAQMLMQSRGQYPPPAQQEILQRFTLEVTDPQTAERWVPLGKTGVTDGQRDAEFSFATLMQGVPIQNNPAFSPVEQIEVLLTLLTELVERCQKTGNIATQEQLVGMETVLNYTGGLIKELATRPDEKEKVKEFGMVMSKLHNVIKGFAQRLAQQKQKQNGQADPAAMAKAQATMQQAQVKSKTTAASAAQKMLQKQAGFVQEQARKDHAVMREQRRKDSATVGEEQRKTAAAIGDARRSQLKSFNDGSEDA